MKRIAGKLKIWQKFALIGALGAALALPPTVMVMQALAAEWHAAENEKAGIAPAERVMTLIQLTQQHRGLTASLLAGADDKAAARLAKQGEVEQATAAALAATAGYSNPRFTKHRDAVTKGWQTLAQDLKTQAVNGPNSFSRHTALISAQTLLLQDVVDASEMSLDPDASRYYLITGVLGGLPRMTEHLAQMRGRGTAALTTGFVTERLRLQFLNQANDMEALVQDTQAAFEKSLEADPALITGLQAPVKASSDAAAQARSLILAQLTGAEPGQMSGADFYKSMSVLIDTQFALSKAAMTVLSSQLVDRAAAARDRMLWMVGLISVGALAVAWLITSVARSTAQQVRRAVGAAEALARGDVSHRLQAETDDEVGQMVRALDSSMRSLSGMVGEIKSASESIATGASQIATGNADLSQRTEQQASNLQETASAMEQLTATVRQNADTAREATRLAGSASAVASRGGEVVGQVVSTMDEISTSSRRIGDIVGVIDSIAFQTNILALNAAVEAARAGEQGRGFAVVAAEVRTLAQRSAEAAREIKSLIGASADKVETGARLVGDAGATMQDIVDQVKRVADLIGEIGSATAEQTTGIGQVSHAVAQLDQVTQQNAALVEESAAAADSLSHQAARLVNSVGRFKVAEDGGPGAAYHAPAAATAFAAAPHPATPTHTAPAARPPARSAAQHSASTSAPLAAAKPTPTPVKALPAQRLVALPATRTVAAATTADDGDDWQSF
ncbi:MAG: hypothetical protein RJA98_1804 [Pseudomonadota bacterium]|jgi:methyl-accepting chemotaxis protein